MSYQVADNAEPHRSRTATGATLFIVDQWAHLPSSMSPTLLTADEILATRAVIDAAFLDSPLMHHPALDEALGCAVMLKVETLNPIRSFKARGTEAVLAALAPRPGAVVAASTGNFGQGIAWSARRRGIAATIYAPDGANPQKVEAMRRLGAVVHLVEPGRDESDAAREAAGETGAPFIEDGAYREIAAGAGTIAQELTGAGLEPDIVLVQIGDGALVTGIGSWLQATSPGVQVVGVTARGAPAIADSVETGRPVERRADTIADGLAITRPVAGALEQVRAAVDEILPVSDDTMLAAMRLLADRAGLLAEPSGAAGIAALMEHRARFQGAVVVSVITGSNVDPKLVPRLVG
jgi:threonine dehydratase